MGRKPKKLTKDYIIQTRITKEYNDRLEDMMQKNKRTKADMARLIIENFIDMQMLSK